MDLDKREAEEAREKKAQTQDCFSSMNQYKHFSLPASLPLIPFSWSSCLSFF
jgi:hypothetical protein